MKRVQSACIMQTLVFSQKPELGFSPERAEALNRDDLEAYKRLMERRRIRYMISSEEVQPDGAIIVRVRKQYNDKASVEEYFA